MKEKTFLNTVSYLRIMFYVFRWLIYLFIGDNGNSHPRAKSLPEKETIKKTTFPYI